jgi:hypothetical protein
MNSTILFLAPTIIIGVFLVTLAFLFLRVKLGANAKKNSTSSPKRNLPGWTSYYENNPLYPRVNRVTKKISDTCKGDPNCPGLPPYYENDSLRKK